MDPMQGMFLGFDIAASGLRAEMQRAEVVASNLTNMHVVGGKTRDPYRRRTVVFEEVLADVAGSLRGLPGADRLAAGVRVREVHEDHETPFVPRFDPSHPEAKDGWVLTSNVDMLQELVDLNVIERSFEANLQALRTYRSMVQDAISNIGRA
jgi:flagellar basal-body rod protein FlgC